MPLNGGHVRDIQPSVTVGVAVYDFFAADTDGAADSDNISASVKTSEMNFFIVLLLCYPGLYYFLINRFKQLFKGFR